MMLIVVGLLVALTATVHAASSQHPATPAIVGVWDTKIQAVTNTAGLAKHDDWDTFLPAVFGVDSTEFETGWRAYLVAYYP